MRIAFSAGIAAARTAQPQRRLAALDPAVAAWLAAVPVALVTLLAILLLGPPLGALLFPTPHARFWPSLYAQSVRPEPTEQARYLIALSAPLLLAGLTLLLARRGVPRRLAAHAAVAAAIIEAAAVLVVAACILAQRLQAPQNYDGDTTPVVYFTLPTIAVALVFAAALTFALRKTGPRARLARLIVETRARRVGAALLALVAVVVALLPALETDASILHAFEAVSYHLGFTYDETMAVIDGRSPLGDFAAQYASLWPYPLAAAMAVLGSSLLVYTGLLAALTGVTLLALYDVLRRLTRSSLALLLFLPLLATFGFRLRGSAVERFSLMNYFGMMPLRYAGPFLLAWLTARHLDRARGGQDRHLWPLFLTGGLATLNDSGLGIAALVATVGALAWGGVRPPRRRATLEALGGVASAYAFVAILLIARTGEPPDLSLLFTYAHTFAVEGFAMLPIRPLFGVGLAIFLTYVAAIGVATVRALRHDSDRLLTGLLAWSGIFGLGAGSYYVGHSLSEVLIYMLPPWALAVTLLALHAIRELAAGAAPRPGRLACLAALGLLVCSLAQTPAPWRQVSRIAVDGRSAFTHPIGERTVAKLTRPGEPVLIIGILGHRIAANLDLDDVEPTTGARSIFTVEQLEDSLAALRAAGGRKVFVLEPLVYPGLIDAFGTAYVRRAHTADGMELWVPR